jgi:hypothetical protein
MHTSTHFIMECCIHSKLPGIFKPVSVDLGRERDKVIPLLDMEECVLDHVDRDAGSSMRQVEEELNVLHKTIWRLLHEQLLYHYHLRVQGLMPVDFSSMRKLLLVSCTKKC